MVSKSDFMNESDQKAILTWLAAAATSVWDVLPQTRGMMVTIAVGVVTVWEKVLIIKERRAKNRQS